MLCLTRASERKHSWATRLTPRWPQFSDLQWFKDPNYHCQKYVITSKSSTWHQNYIMTSQYVITSKSSSWGQKYFMTSKSALWRQKVHHDVKDTSWCQKVRHDIQQCVTSASWRQKNASWRQTYIMTSISSSWRQKYFIMSKSSEYIMTWTNVSCQKYVMTAKSSSWRQKVREQCYVSLKSSRTDKSTQHQYTNFATASRLN